MQEQTLRRETEEKLEAIRDELIHAAQLVAIGKTLTTLLHEINQPLNALSAYLFTAERALERKAPADVATILKKSSLLVERTSQMIQRLRHFSRKADEALPLKAVNVIECLSEAWALLNILHQNRQAVLEVTERPLYVMADEILLQQVFVNLFANALEAATNDKPFIRIRTEVTGTHILIFISDNGPGWPVNTMTEPLQPFSSTKTANLGIGLSVSGTIMERFSGQMLIASTLEHNAMVILQLRKALHVE